MADTVDSSTPFPAIARCIDLPVASSGATRTALKGGVQAPWGIEWATE